MKARIKKTELKIKRTDYRYFENDKHIPVAKYRMPSRDLLKSLAWKTKAEGRDTGWRVFPRFSIRVELLKDFRNDAGKARDKFIWGTTYDPHTSDLDLFWRILKKALQDEPPTTRERIIKQVAKYIPLPV